MEKGRSGSNIEIHDVAKCMIVPPPPTVSQVNFLNKCFSDKFENKFRRGLSGQDEGLGLILEIFDIS